MCGICGLVRNGSVKKTEVEVMAAALEHRGPDDTGFCWQDGVGLGHRRLSIIDLENGRQPMPNEDESVWVVFNGVIYNYRDLRKELSSRGHEFRTTSDTEVIVHLYEDEGADCVHRLRGMFAFAIWDRRCRRLFAACDRLGQKPFHYVHRGDELAFASEIKALLAWDSSLNELAPEALDQFLTLRFVAAPHTMFRRIRKLPAAHRLFFDVEGGLRTERYWDVSFGPKLRGNDDDLSDEIEARLVEALRLHAVSDVPLGAFLSGGLDSPLVVALLRSYLPSEPLRTFSASFEHGDHDEAPLARLVAERYRTEHVVAHVRPPSVAQLVRMISHLDEPADPLTACFDGIAEVASRSVKVVFGGDGGDELFGGYDRYRGFTLADRYARIPTALRHIFGSVIDRIPEGGWYRSAGKQLQWLHRHSFVEGAARYAAMLSYFGLERNLRRTLYGQQMELIGRDGDPEAVVREAFEQAPSDDPLDRMTYVDWQVRLAAHSLMMLDRMAMSHGLETRSPFLDHELIELSARLPQRLKIRGGSLRWTERRLAARYLPEPLLRRPKQGFASALPYLLSDTLDPSLSALLEHSHLASAGLFDQEGVDRIVQKTRAGSGAAGGVLWLLLAAEVWFRLRIEGASADDFIVPGATPSRAGPA